MMSDLRLILSDPARAELANLWVRYAAVSEDLADRILHRLRHRIVQLSRFPELGRPRPEFNLPGLRSVAVNPHVIFYSISDPPNVIIHHVADGRRNLAALFGHEQS
jgi:plasmid stabilization system protein ParE